MVRPDRIRLVVLFGGQSAEHEVSCTTAAHVLNAADPQRYEVLPVGITREGTWVRAEGALEALRRGAYELPGGAGPAASEAGTGETTVAPLQATGTAVEPLPVVSPSSSDLPVVVMPLLHGTYGEDGTVQGLLELAGVPYVGAGVLSSALCMDKVKAKEVLAAHGLPHARWVAIHASEIDDAAAAIDATGLACPLFVKPANLGSSVGVSKVHTPAEMPDALALASSYDEWLVVEEAIDGREIEVAVLGNREPRASLPGEIVPSHEFYDYDDKYIDGTCELRVPAPLDVEETAQVRELACQAYRALRCEGMARADFFFEEAGRGFLVNELNTIPGFTPGSMYPKLWEATGLDYPQLIDELVDLAIERHERRSRFTTKR